SGSRLPVCPAFAASNSRFARCSALFDVMPLGLSSSRMPRTFRPRFEPIALRSVLVDAPGTGRVFVGARVVVVAAAGRVVLNARRTQAVDEPGQLGAAAGALVANEVELRSAPQPQRMTDPAAQKAVRLREPGLGVLRGSVRIERRVVDSRD